MKLSPKISSKPGERLHVLTYHRELVRRPLFEDEAAAALAEPQAERRRAVLDEPPHDDLVSAFAGEAFGFDLAGRKDSPTHSRRGDAVRRQRGRGACYPQAANLMPSGGTCSMRPVMHS